MNKKEITIGDVIDCIADNNTLTSVEIWRNPYSLLWEGEIENLPDVLRKLTNFTFWTCFKDIKFDVEKNNLATVKDVIEKLEVTGDVFFKDRCGRTIDIPNLLDISEFEVVFFNNDLIFTVYPPSGVISS